MLILIPLADDEAICVDPRLVKSILPVREGEQGNFPAAKCILRYDNGAGSIEQCISKMDIKLMFQFIISNGGNQLVSAVTDPRPSPLRDKRARERGRRGTKHP